MVLIRLALRSFKSCSLSRAMVCRSNSADISAIRLIASADTSNGGFVTVISDRYSGDGVLGRVIIRYLIIVAKLRKNTDY